MAFVRALLAVVIALAAPGASRAADIQSKSQELETVRHELDAARREIERYRRIQESLTGQLGALKSQNAHTQQLLMNLKRNIRVAQARKDALASRLRVLGLSSGLWRSSLDNEVRAYQRISGSRDDAYGLDDIWKEELRRSAIREKIGMIQGLEAVGERTRLAQVETHRQAEALLGRTREAEEQARRVAEEERKTREAAAEAERKKELAMKRAQELVETEKALTRLIRALVIKRNLAPKPGAVKLERPIHSLPWPVEGRVSTAFGRSRDPELGSWRISQGVWIETAPGAEIHSVDNGRVIFSGMFRSYGRIVIVDHGGGFFSIYGGLSQSHKEKGSLVARGEAVGMAETAGGKGKMYLEFRLGTEALDPILWLSEGVR